MRKAVWGAVALGVLALHFASPVREIPILRTLASLGGLAGYLLLSFDPPVSDARRFRAFLIAGIVSGLAGFLITITGSPYPLSVLAKVGAVGSVALPLWLVAGPARYAFVIAAAFALSTALPAINEAGPYATSIHAYVAAVGAWWVAVLMHKPSILAFGQGNRKRLVVASNIVTLSPEQKAAALAKVEQRYQNGEIPEHKYWDMRQEIESR